MSGRWRCTEGILKDVHILRTHTELLQGGAPWAPGRRAMLRRAPDRCCRSLDGLQVEARTVLSAAPTCYIQGIRQGLKGHFNHWCPGNVERYSSKEIKLERSRMVRETHLRSLVKYKANIGSCWPAKWTKLMKYCFPCSFVCLSSALLRKVWGVRWSFSDVCHRSGVRNRRASHFMTWQRSLISSHSLVSCASPHEARNSHQVNEHLCSAYSKPAGTWME